MGFLVFWLGTLRRILVAAGIRSGVRCMVQRTSEKEKRPFLIWWGHLKEKRRHFPMGWPLGQKNGQKWPFFGLWGVQVENDFSIKCPTDAPGLFGTIFEAFETLLQLRKFFWRHRKALFWPYGPLGGVLMAIFGWKNGFFASNDWYMTSGGHFGSF